MLDTSITVDNSQWYSAWIPTQAISEILVPLSGKIVLLSFCNYSSFLSHLTCTRTVCELGVGLENRLFCFRRREKWSRLEISLIVELNKRLSGRFLAWCVKRRKTGRESVDGRRGNFSFLLPLPCLLLQRGHRLRSRRLSRKNRFFSKLEKSKNNNNNLLLITNLFT